MCRSNPMTSQRKFPVVHVRENGAVPAISEENQRSVVQVHAEMSELSVPSLQRAVG